MVDIFLICVIVVSFVILLIVGLYFVIKYQHPDDKNDAYIPKLVVWLGLVLAGATVLLLPLDVANNEGYAGTMFFLFHLFVARMEEFQGWRRNATIIVVYLGWPCELFQLLQIPTHISFRFQDVMDLILPYAVD